MKGAGKVAIHVVRYGCRSSTIPQPRLLGLLATCAAVVLGAGVPPVAMASLPEPQQWRVTAGPYSEVDPVYCAGLTAAVHCLALAWDRPGPDELGAPSVLYSADGGATWAHRSLPKEDAATFAQVSCAEAPKGIDCAALSGPQVYGSTHMTTAWSTDAGQSWSYGATKTIPYASALTCTAVGTGVDCVALSLSDRVAYSTDGGATWKAARLSVATSAIATIALEGVSCVDEQARADCAAVGDSGAGQAALVMYYSADGGATWAPSSFASQRLPSMAGSWVACAPTRTGVDCAETNFATTEQASSAFYSTNGGKSWAKSTGKAQAELSCASAGTSAECASGPFFSRDGGANWQVATLAPSVSAILAETVIPAECFRSGAGAACFLAVPGLAAPNRASAAGLYYSANGGDSWEAAPLPPGYTQIASGSPLFPAVTCSSSLVCIAGGFDRPGSGGGGTYVASTEPAAR